MHEDSLQEYLSEGEEILQRINICLNHLESGRVEKSLIQEFYRDVHTLKGTSMLFGFSNIGQISHLLESCLDPMREGGEIPGSNLLSLFYRSVDLIEKYLRDIKINKFESQSYDNEKLEIITKMTEEFSSEFFGKQNLKVDSLFNLPEDMEIKKLDELKKELRTLTETITGPEGEVERGEKKEDSSNASSVWIVSEKKDCLDSFSQEEISQSSIREEFPIENIQESKTQKINKEKEIINSKNKTGNTMKDSSIRVNVDLLDRMMNLVGELVLVRNQVLQHADKTGEMHISSLSQGLDIVTSQLQSEIMKTRMQPIGNVLNKFMRIARDIASDLGKKIRVESIGNETELDKTLLEAIRDPLTHIIRNCCDHGIEGPQERSERGKSEEGLIKIKSYHEGGQVIVEVSDDGRGMQKSKIIQKALEKGLVSEERLEKMTEKEVFDLILLPGFSTASQVSSVSGRGVGMDIVKTNIEKIGGSVEISSREGSGTEIKMKIPLTLAIVPAMIVRVQEQSFCIPQIRLAELVRVENKRDEKSHLDFLQGRPVLRLRGNLLPLVGLKHALGLPSRFLDGQYLKEEVVNLVVLNYEGGVFGLVVDEIFDAVDIVVKPINQFLKSIGVFSGATIMGDGSVSLILDVMGLLERANLNINRDDYAINENKRNLDASKSYHLAQEFLTFSIGHKNKYAVPLCLVHRLEKVHSDRVEFVGTQKVIQYRGDVLPIVNLLEELGFANQKSQDVSKELGKSSKNEELVNLIVCQKAGLSFGVEVGDIEDVVTIMDEINESISDRAGLLGNIVYNSQVIVVVDILNILDKVIEKISTGNSQFHAQIEAEDYKVHKGANILLVEDTSFFRKKISSVLNKSGYKVTTVNNGQEALDLLSDAKSKNFHLILSDIEMPFVDGYQLAETIRKNPDFSEKPLIAITTKFRDKDIERGKAIGFDDYLEKLNEEQLLKSIDKWLSKGA